MIQSRTRTSVRRRPRLAVRPTYLAGLGTAVPSRQVSNDEIASRLEGTTAEDIELRTGIRCRFHATDGQTTADLAAEASRKALERSEVEADAIDLILLATSTPDHLMPATACRVQHLLNARQAVAMDLSAACSGFVYALWVGQQFIQTGQAKSVLVIGADLMSRIVDPKDRDCAMVFGDGAGAAVLTASEGPYRLGRFWAKTQGDQYDSLIREGGAVSALTTEGIAAGRHFLRMAGRRVFRAAVAAFCEAIEETAAANQLAMKEVDWFVPHQCNERILGLAAEKLGISLDRFWRNMARYGNTAAASIPLALAELDRKWGVMRDSRILLAAVGAGMTSGGTVLFAD